MQRKLRNHKLLSSISLNGDITRKKILLKMNRSKLSSMPMRIYDVMTNKYVSQNEYAEKCLQINLNANGRKS